MYILMKIYNIHIPLFLYTPDVKDIFNSVIYAKIRLI